MSSPENFFSKNELIKMSLSREWRSNLIIEQINNTNINTNKSTRNTKYKLHPTQKCDLFGRIYVALPSDTNVSDPNVKNKYNLF